MKTTNRIWQNDNTKPAPQQVENTAVPGLSQPPDAIFSESGFKKRADKNPRLLLDDDLRKRVSHLSLDEIRILVTHLERDLAGLRVFLRTVKLPVKTAPGGWKQISVQMCDSSLEEMRLMAKAVGWPFHAFVEFALRNFMMETRSDAGGYYFLQCSPKQFEAAKFRLNAVRDLIHRSMPTNGLN